MFPITTSNISKSIIITKFKYKRGCYKEIENKTLLVYYNDAINIEVQDQSHLLTLLTSRRK
jgi:hypothetical protein